MNLESCFLEKVPYGDGTGSEYVTSETYECDVARSAVNRRVPPLYGGNVWELFHVCWHGKFILSVLDESSAGTLTSFA